MRPSARFSIGLVALVSLVLAGSAASPSAFAGSEPGLAFPVSSAPAFSWDDLKKGQDVAICNGGSEDADPLEQELSGFEFKRTDKRSGKERQLGIGKVLTVTLPEGGVPKGKCRAVMLGLVDEEVVVDPGDYTGSLAVLAPGLGVAQLAVTVSGPGAVAKAAAVKGALEQATLEAENPTPWDDPELTEDSDLLLKLPENSKESLSIGKGCKQNGDDWTAQCAFIGNLYQGTDIISVFIAGEAVSAKEEGVARLPIRIEGSHAVGDYEGVLDPSLTGDKEQAIKTKLTAKDPFEWALFVLLLAVVIATCIQLWWSRWRLRCLLEAGGNRLVASYEAACKEVNARKAELRPGESFTIELDKPAVEKYVGEIITAIARYGRSTLLFDTESEAYKQIESSVEIAEEDLKALADKDGLQQALIDLATGVTKTEELLSRNNLVRKVPELLTRARALLKERKFAVGDATAREKKAGELTASLDSWRKLFARLLEEEAWLFALAKLAREGSVPEEDKKVLADLAVRLRTVHEELLRAEGDEDLGRLRISRQLESAHGQISYLVAKYGIEKPLEKPVDLFKADLLDPVEKAFEGFFGGVEGRNLSDDEGEVLSEPASAVQMPAGRFGIVFVDSLVLAFVAVAAVFTGLSAFYFGKNFGTPFDYATVVLTAAAAQVIAKAVLDNFSAFWHDISPLTDVQVARAKVVAKAD